VCRCPFLHQLLCFVSWLQRQCGRIRPGRMRTELGRVLSDTYSEAVLRRPTKTVCCRFVARQRRCEASVSFPVVQCLYSVLAEFRNERGSPFYQITPSGYGVCQRRYRVPLFALLDLQRQHCNGRHISISVRREHVELLRSRHSSWYPETHNTALHPQARQLAPVGVKALVMP